MQIDCRSERNQAQAMIVRKQKLFLFLLLFFSTSAEGQEPVSLTKDDLLPWTDKGAYLSVDFTNTTLAGESAGMNGIQIAYIHKHWLSAGLSYYSLPSPFSYNNHFYDITYGGPVVQLMLKPKHLFFVSVGASSGIGYINEDSSKSHAFLYASPEFRIWANITSFMRLSFLTAYRFPNNQGTDIEISGKTIGFSIVYGKF